MADIEGGPPPWALDATKQLKEEDRKRFAIHTAGPVIAHIRLFPEQKIGKFQAGGVVEIGLHLLSLQRPENEKEQLLQDEQFDKLAIVFCSSYGALLTAGYSKEQSALHCGTSIDGRGNFEIASKMSTEPLSVIKEKAVNLMELRKNRRAVELLSDELIKRNWLDHEWAIEVTELADGFSDEAAYEMYVRNRERI